MALKGTLKDFGIADILQLIGHQMKTGVLKLTNKDQEVLITFDRGNVVKAESQTRDRQDLLGNMLVRAELLDEEQLDTALAIQRRTLKRLGDILVSSDIVPRETVRDIARLQTTETIYKLFVWRTGTYEFEQQAIDYDPESYEPIRSESVLMEGFRMVDEWPMIRKRITSYAMRFEALKPLPEQKADSGRSEDEDIMAGLDDAFAAMQEGEDLSEAAVELGDNEYRVYRLITPEREVQKLIDLSRLGEFETCKALLNLLNAGYLLAIPPTKGVVVEVPIEGGALIEQRPSFPLVPILVRGVMTLLLLASLLGLIRVVVSNTDGLVRGAEQRIEAQPVEEALSELSYARLEFALEVYFLTTGRYPDQLVELVDANLLALADLRFPWVERFEFHREEKGYSLLRPFR